MSEIFWNPLVPELTVTDFARSLDFYTRLLGFTVRYSRSEPDFAYLDCGGAQLMLEARHEGDWKVAELEAPLGRGINFTIEMSGVDACCQRVLAAGWPLFQPLRDRSYMVNKDEESVMREFLLQDPDGYLLRPSQYLEKRARRN